MKHSYRKVTPRTFVQASAIALAVLTVGPAVAHAGGINDNYDIIHLRPFVGYEVSRVSALEADINSLSARSILSA